MPLPDDFLAELRHHFTGDIRNDAASRILYSTDASIYQVEPLGVVIPRTQDDLQAVVELASRHRVPILARGSGSSLAGQAIGAALIIDCTRWLDHLISIDPEAQTATVEPGLVLANLNLAAARHGLMYGPDPASAERATMGGVIANNATGAHSITYGMTADHLRSVDALLSDGSLATFSTLSLRARRISGRGNLVPESNGNAASSPNPSSRFDNFVRAALDIRTQHADLIRARYPRSWRNSAGYRLNYLLPWSATYPAQWPSPDYPAAAPGAISLAPLIAGSEGTLAIIRRATVGLVARPRCTVLGILSYDSVSAACDAAPELLERHPSAIELIPRMILQLARTVPGYASQMGWVSGDPGAVLVVEYSGDALAPLMESARKLRPDVVLASTADEQARVWNVRRVGLGLLDTRPRSARSTTFIEDCAIPVEHLGEFVREIESLLRDYHTEGGLYGHASAGTIHIRPILDLKTPEGVRALRPIAERVLALTLRLGGAMSSEHGDGIVRGEWLKATYGSELVDVMRSLKRAADPDNLLNPGKMFDAPPMDEQLRYGLDYHSHPWQPALSFASGGGLALAIEQCNGQGVCRKDTGVMCPSFQATREEMHSTRGRANLLRSFIASPAAIPASAASQPGDAPLDPISEQRVFEALDLCLMCKGCKAECPSGVDMAKLKTEFLSRYYDHHPRRLRDYVFGYFHITARILSAFAPVVNFATSLPFVRAIMFRILHLAPQRPFPKFATKRAKVVIARSPGGATKQSRSVDSAIIGEAIEALPPAPASLSKPSQNPRAPEGADPTPSRAWQSPSPQPLIPRPRVLFLREPFTHYVDTAVEQAAFDLLAARGYEIVSLRTIGASAALLSKGFVRAACSHSGRLLDEIAGLDPNGELPVVCVEPSELYAFRHELLDLHPERHDEVSTLAARAWTVEEFLIRLETTSDSPSMRIGTIQPGILFHPHCHQKAEPPALDGLPTGSAATTALLQACGYAVEQSDAGCCGMAGTFGYEAEHYELSQQVGALRLFPHVTKREGLPVAATGAACRMQIAQATGANVQHPLVFAAQALRSP